MINQPGIINDDRGQRIYINSAVAHDLDSALTAVRDIFAQAQQIKVPENHELVETNVSVCLSASIVPIATGDVQRISDTQISYIIALGKRSGINPYTWVRELFDCDVRQLNKVQSYAMIATMEKSIKTVEEKK